jgi:hypothetical protein
MKKSKELGKKNEGKEYKKEMTKDKAAKIITNEINSRAKLNKADEYLQFKKNSLEELKTHLEGQFQEGMSWDNYGIYTVGNNNSGWHIDHIIPCAAFNLEDDFERNACFYYQNLQPLWGKDNIIKSDTFDNKEKEEYIEMYRIIINENS